MNYSIRRPIFFLTLLFFGVVSAQEINFKPKIDFFRFPNFELNTDEITDIQTDQEGYVWIISLSSIYKYNGSDFIKINTNHVNHGSFIRFHVDPHGRKYIIDYLSNIFFINRNKLLPYKHNKILREKNIVALIPTYQFDKQGVLHIANPSTKHFILKNDSMIDMCDQYKYYRGHAVKFIDDTIPFAFFNGIRGAGNTIKRKFYLFDNTFNILDSIDIIHNKVVEHNSLVQKANGNFLYSTGIGSIIEFSRNKVIRQYNYPNTIIRLFVDNSGNLWVSTKDDGIHFYKDGKIDTTHLIKYFENSMAFVSTQDYQGGIWLYSKDHGLGYISNPSLDFEEENNFKIDLHGNTLYYGINKQVWKYAEESNSSEFIKHFDFNSPITSLFYDSSLNRLFVSSSNTSTYLKDQQFNLINKSGFRNPEDACMPRFIINDPKYPSRIVAVTKYHHFIFNEHNLKTKISQRYPTVIKDIVKQGDSIWATSTNGIYLTTDSRSIEYMGDHYPMAQNYANDFILFKNQKFFSFPAKGIYFFENKQFKEVQYQNSSLLNCRLAIENDSVLWALSEDGCFSITPSRGETPYQVKAYHPLPRIIIDQLEQNQEYIYFTTNQGSLARIRFDDIRSNPLQSPRLLIKAVETTDSIFTAVENHKIALSYNNRNIQFSFESIDFKNLNLTYRYRLKGTEIEDQWHSTSTQSVNYASLPPGDYTFSVQSKFGLGDWCEPKHVAFTIATPFWQESWFIIGAILLSLILISQIIAYRYKVIYREQRLSLARLQSEQKALRALMTPHYFFNFVSSLQYLIAEETRERANRFLSLFSSSMRNILHQSDTRYITIENELKFMEEYLEMERFRLDGLFDFTIEIASDINKSDSIPPFLIQPFAENAIEHGLKGREEGGKLSLKFENEEPYLKVTIEDNGSGRANSGSGKKGKSFGISLIRKRLSLHNQSEKGVEIFDLYDEEQNPSGTRVRIYIKRIKNNH